MNPEPSTYGEMDVVTCTRVLIFECLIEGEIRISIGAGSKSVPILVRLRGQLD